MIRLRLLGECLIEVDGAQIGPDSERLFAVLLHLVLERGRSVSRAALIQLFWPRAADENGRHNLRQAIYKLRQLGVPLDCTQSHIHLPADAVVDGDRGVAPPDAVDALARRAAGPALLQFLPEYAPAFSPAFTEWVEEQREYAHAQVRRALTAAMLDRRAHGRWGEVEALARCVLQLDPLNEEATLALAEAAALCGGKSQALSILDRYMAELGPGAADIRLPASVLRKRIAERLQQTRYSAPSEAHFVGRAESLAHLTALLQSARSAHGRSTLIWGPAGIGKSRLAAEFFKVAVLQGAHTQRVTCQASDPRRPLSVFVDLVPALLQMPGSLGCSPRSMGYLRRLTEHDTRMAGPTEDTKEAEYLYANVRQALFDLFDAVQGECCLVVLIEDVHWLDALSWDVLRELITWSATRRLLFLFTSRTAHATPSPSGDAVSVERHRLPNLDPGASAELLEALTRDDGRPATEEFRDWCARVSEGNPFYLRELASAWRETGAAHAVPSSLATLLDDRVARLGPMALRALQACAVLGKHATLERVQAVLQYKNFELMNAVEELDGGGMLAVDGASVPSKHALLSEAALRPATETTRRLLHRQAALVLEQEVEATHSAAVLWECAQHWQTAGEVGRALRLVRSCAEHLLEVGLPADAAEIYERALPLAETTDDRLQLLQGWSYALRLCGRWINASSVLRELIDLRQRVQPEQDRHHPDELDLLHAEWRSGADLNELFCRALECSMDVTASPSHRVQAASRALIFGDYLCSTEMMRVSYDAIRDVLESSEVDARSRCRVTLIYETVCGDLSEGIEAARELVTLMEALESPAVLASALLNSSLAFRRAGLFGEAASSLDRALRLSERHSFAATALTACDFLCGLSFDRQDLQSAKRWHERAQSWRDRSDDLFATRDLAFVATRIALTEGRIDDAESSLNFSEQDVLSDPVLRRRAHAEAYWLDIQMARRADISESAVLADLERIHSSCRVMGGYDYCAQVLFSALKYIGRGKEARYLAHEYVTKHRRETYELTPDLSVWNA